MINLINFNFLKSNYLNLLIVALPLSFIAGNMIINLNVILLLFSSFILYGKKLLNVRFYLIDKLIILYFFIILTTAVINDYEFYFDLICGKENFQTIFKSFLFIRYLLLYFVIRYLIENKIINLKYFFISCTLASLFVSFDILYQFINGEDLFGYKSINSGRKLGGPFGDELIAGGYIQRFSLFSFFLIPVFYKKKFQYLTKYFIPIFFIVFFISIVLSGNRMPMVMFVFSIFLIILFQKQTRKFFFPSLVIFVFLFSLILNYNKNVKNNFTSFYNQISNTSAVILNQNLKATKSTQYLREFSTFYDTWLMNKFLGGGVKNFRCYCHHRPNIDKNSKFICNMHPHNYYLEILTETGIIGLVVILSVFILILYRSFYSKYFSNLILKENNIIVPFIFLFLVEIFPIKSTGSFFTTGNTTYLILIMAILIALNNTNNSIEKKI